MPHKAPIYLSSPTPHTVPHEYVFLDAYLSRERWGCIEQVDRTWTAFRNLTYHLPRIAAFHRRTGVPLEYTNCGYADVLFKEWRRTVGRDEALTHYVRSQVDWTIERHRVINGLMGKASGAPEPWVADHDLLKIWGSIHEYTIEDLILIGRRLWCDEYMNDIIWRGSHNSRGHHHHLRVEDQRVYTVDQLFTVS